MLAKDQPSKCAIGFSGINYDESGSMWRRRKIPVLKLTSVFALLFSVYSGTSYIAYLATEISN